MYGPRGFYQYQCVLPHAVRRDALQAMLATIRQSGDGSFLAMLKTFGSSEPVGMLSFPMQGATLALDFPNKGETTLALFDRLDAIVAEAGGRIYAAKDARMPRALFEAGFPRLAEFVPYRDPGISSSMSRRLLGS
jgi:FAD/FMN-containing dehydrogenase